MCTNNRLVKIPIPEDYEKNIWKYPKQLAEQFKNNEIPTMAVKCGKCYECKKENARNWIYKIWLESLRHKDKCFITLTYKNKPKYNNLEKKELQKFIKRLRKDNPNNEIKYFGAGEYGETYGRPHYHIIILGYKPNDMKFWKLSKRGHRLYRSKYIRKLWGLGIETIQPFHPDEIGYLTLYLNKNDEMKKDINKKALAYKTFYMNELKIKHGILDIQRIGKNTKLVKKRRIKDLTKEKYKAYKKDYNELNKKITMTKEPEFQIYSKGMGWNTYIDKKYYKYDMILNNYKYEIPKEYLRKVIENIDKYKNNEELISYTVNEILNRKEYTEDEYKLFINLKDQIAILKAIEHNKNMLKQDYITQQRKQEIIKEIKQLEKQIEENYTEKLRIKEIQKMAINKNNIKLYKRHNSPF